MTIEGWIHPVNSMVEAKALVKFIKGHKALRVIKHFAILNGTLETIEGRIVGEDNKRTLLIMYNSSGKREFLEDMKNEPNINNIDSLFTLNDLKDVDKEYIGDDEDIDMEDEDGVAWKIKNTDYIDWNIYYDLDTDEVISDFFQGKDIITLSFDSSE